MMFAAFSIGLSYCLGRNIRASTPCALLRDDLNFDKKAIFERHSELNYSVS